MRYKIVEATDLLLKNRIVIGPPDLKNGDILSAKDLSIPVSKIISYKKSINIQSENNLIVLKKLLEIPKKVESVEETEATETDLSGKKPFFNITSRFRGNEQNKTEE